MSLSRCSLGILIASSVGLGACSAVGPRDGEEPSSSRRGDAIVNGQETSDYPATGLMLHDGQGSCTGTLVAPRTVLTAGHCVEQADPSSLSFGFGAAEDQLEQVVQVVSAVQHPNWDSQQLANDVAVLTLAEDAPVQRVSMNPKMDSSWVGKTVTLVGFGVTDGPSQTGFGTKRMVDVTIDQVDATSLHYTTEQGKTACNGDSGGPAFVEENGNLLVVGVTSYGDEKCQEFGVYTRVDAYLDFIYGEIAKAGPVDPNSPQDPNDPNNPNDPNDPNDPNNPNPGGGCGKETWEGRCDGNTVIWCEEDQVQSIDCQACGFVPEAGFYDCVN